MKLDKLTQDCKSLLDIGCGSNSPINSFSKRMHCVGVDLFEPSIIKSKSRGIHNEYHLMSFENIPNKFKENEFDCVLASDFIAHLKKEGGYELLKIMEKIAKKKVIVFTPNDFQLHGKEDENPLGVFRSKWTVEEMKKKGYKIWGINGLKNLRGDCAKILFKPRLFWLSISSISQYYTKYLPKKAFHLLCVKDMSR